MPLLLQIIGQVLAAVIPPILNWMFSGSVLNGAEVVPGLPDLDRKHSDQPINLPDFGT